MDRGSLFSVFKNLIIRQLDMQDVAHMRQVSRVFRDSREIQNYQMKIACDFLKGFGWKFHTKMTKKCISFKQQYRLLKLLQGDRMCYTRSKACEWRMLMQIVSLLQRHHVQFLDGRLSHFIIDQRFEVELMDGFPVHYGSMLVKNILTGASFVTGGVFLVDLFTRI